MVPKVYLIKIRNIAHFIYCNLTAHFDRTTNFIIHNMVTGFPLQCKLCRILSMDMYVGGQIHLDINMQDSGKTDYFPEKTECTPWFFKMSASNLLKGAFKVWSVQ